MPRAAAARPMPQLLDSFLTLQQEIWDQSFRLLSAFARPAALPMDPATAAEAAGLIESLSHAPARTARAARPVARSPRSARPSASQRERPTASAGSKRRAARGSKRK